MLFRSWPMLLTLSLCACAATGSGLRLEQDGGGSEPTGATASSPPVDTWHVHLGVRSLDDQAWEDIDQQALLGFEGAHHAGGRNLGWEYGVFVSSEETDVAGVDVTGSLFELSVGPRYRVGRGPVFGVIGLGVSLLYADVEAELGGITVSDDDTTFGGYGHVGAFTQLGRNFLLGLDARLGISSDVDLVGIDSDTDYTALSLTLGWRP